MEISHVEMDRISDQHPSIPSIGGYAPHNQSGGAPGAKDGRRDSFVLDSARQYLRDLCDTGEAVNHIEEIIQSGIEPDFLRAELAFRFVQGETAILPIIISYLAGNFKEAASAARQLEETDGQKFQELILFADYFAGRFEQGCEQMKNFPTLNFSPFFCYAYSDMLLSLGYVDEAKEYQKKYVMLARRYLKNFVSEKEKYTEARKQREKWRGRQEKKGENPNGGRNPENDPLEPNAEKGPARGAQSEQSPALYGLLRELIERRRKLLEVLKTQNVNIDKRPLLFELEDIDAVIAQTSGRFERTGGSNLPVL